MKLLSPWSAAHCARRTAGAARAPPPRRCSWWPAGYYLRNALAHWGTPLVGQLGSHAGVARADLVAAAGVPHPRLVHRPSGSRLRHPYLAGFHSFWDGLYSTFWGDGGIAGRVYPADRHGLWSYDFMSAGYLLAIPATLLLLLGALRALGMALRDPDHRRRIAFSFLLTASWAVFFSLGFLTLRLPFFAQAKASYALCLITPLSLFFALGADRLDAALAEREALAAPAAAGRNADRDPRLPLPRLRRLIPG